MPDSVLVREAVERIVASAGFANSPRMSRFLRFVVEESLAGRASDLKEYVIGLRAFDKAESFDPSVDTTVRVEASKLRTKLARYYETEGRSDSIRIDIPKGHYAASFHESTRAAALDRRPRALSWAVVGMLVVTAGLAGWTLRPEPPVAGDITRSLLALRPFGEVAATWAGSTPAVLRPVLTALALSPDGSMLVFAARGRDRTWQLHLRRLDRLESAPIAGTEDGVNPFFSPDGKWLGFWANGELKKVPLAGGPVSTICKMPGRVPRHIHGASWGAGDIIVFGTLLAAGGGLWQVSALGGEPHVLSNPTPSELSHRLPHMLPGGHAVLFTIARMPFRWDDAQIAVRSLVTGEQKILLDDGADARYVPSGHLVFARRGTLMAAPFDLARLEVTGTPVALVEGLMQSVNMPNTVADSGAAHFSVSNRGVLVYATGGIRRDDPRGLVWVDRTGTSESLPVPPSPYYGPQLALTDKRVAVFTTPSGNSRVWTLDPNRGVLTAFTTVDERAAFNVWAPDGERIAFFSQAQRGIFWKNADGTGTPRRVTQTTGFQQPSAWAPDSKVLAFVESDLHSGEDIWGVDVSGSQARPKAIIQTKHEETHPAFSPDGRWLAYTSNDSGRSEIYVQRYPGPGHRLRVSTQGGNSPAWRGDGRELYYLERRGPVAVGVVAVRIHADGEEIAAGVPHGLFEGRFVVMSGGRSYDVTPDGQRFLMVQHLEPSPEPDTQLVLVNNWIRELHQLMATK